MQSEWNLEGSEYMILSRKNDKILTFDIKLETSQGVLFAVRIKNGQESIAATINDKAAPKKVHINVAQALFGQLSIKMTQNISKTIGRELTGGAIKCKHCEITRGWQRNVKMKTDHFVSTKVGERTFLDVIAVMQNQDSDASVNSTSKRY
jgi:hypothetical protein